MPFPACYSLRMQKFSMFPFLRRSKWGYLWFDFQSKQPKTITLGKVSWEQPQDFEEIDHFRCD